MDALRPQRSHDARRARAPIEGADDRVLDLEGIHQRNDVLRNSSLLGIARRIRREESGTAVATQGRNDDPVAGGHQLRSDFVERMDVVRPAMQKDDHRAIGRANVDVADPEIACIDGFQVGELANAATTR